MSRRATAAGARGGFTTKDTKSHEAGFLFLRVVRGEDFATLRFAQAASISVLEKSSPLNSKGSCVSADSA